ncbi:hypothetical protein, partial [[Clostridium] scindens]|uniref:hypothetical protein n=1 Tax=Clostridium scindens (strain JCM 10418 / VPI 12708) TaxID=29347 RepID=UPI001A9B3451
VQAGLISVPLIPNLSLYLIQKFDRLALWGNLTILELHFAETQAFNIHGFQEKEQYGLNIQKSNSGRY